MQSDMHTNLFADFVQSNRARLEDGLADTLPRVGFAGAERFNEALEYALFPGGKRLRAYLTLIAARLSGTSEYQALTLACAVEFIHTSSLVLDDLPSMDDADLRRRRPALHLRFGEGTALLVALGLLNQAYALFARAGADDHVGALLAECSSCIGARGMIAGQAIELALSGDQRPELIPASRDLKTSALMRLMLVAGAIAVGRSEEDIEALGRFGHILGEVYQIQDDLADILSDPESAEKTVGQDQRHTRPNQARAALIRDADPDAVSGRAAALLETGKKALDRFSSHPDAALLKSAADVILASFPRTRSAPPTKVDA
jgi:geranylgeranyl pyrophosphate synthase